MKGRIWNRATTADLNRYPPEAVFEAGERNHHVSNTSYPIAHSSVWKPYRVGRPLREQVVSRAFQGVDDLCLYVHIPFCEARCSYCEYTVVGKHEMSETAAYMQRLSGEMAMYRDLLDTRRRTLHGFDIGGGTPSFVEAELIAELLGNVRASFRFGPSCGISIETTPRIAALEGRKLEAYAQAGVERISMGVQVIEPDLLRVLNRSGNGVEHHNRAVENIRRAGFAKFNLDLMYGFAGQSLESWRATVEHAVSLGPEYITLYRMRYKLTRISEQAPRVRLEAVHEQAALAKRLLADAGYQANPGKNTYSRIEGDPGTSDYLTRRVVDGMPYLGLGLGAQTFTHTTIGYNDGAAGKTLTPYASSVEAGRLPIQDLYDLPLTHMMAKMAAVSFYFGQIDRASFHEKFGIALEEAFAEEVDFVLERGLMRYTDRALSLTAEGARRFNGVIALFFAPSVQAYLIDRDPDRADDMTRNLAHCVECRTAGRDETGIRGNDWIRFRLQC